MRCRADVSRAVSDVVQPVGCGSSDSTERVTKMELMNFTRIAHVTLTPGASQDPSLFNVPPLSKQRVT
jgi:hypothetical protein